MPCGSLLRLCSGFRSWRGGAVRCALATTDEDRVSGRCDRGAHGARLVLEADRDGVLSVRRDGAAGVGISPVLDLQVAWLVMKVGGGVVLWSFILVIFIRSATRELESDRAQTARRRPTSQSLP